MFKIKSATRLAISVGIGCATLIWLAISLGLINDPVQLQLDRRIDLTKNLAVSVTSFAESKRTNELKNLVARTVQTNDEIESIGVRRHLNKRYISVSGPHEENWNPYLAQDPDRQVSVEILANGKPWGTMEVSFISIRSVGLASLFAFPVGLIGFITSAMILITWLILCKTFKYLNPSTVVPDRVRSALDTLAEGLVLTDPSGEIAHANEAFLSIMQLEGEDVLGMKLDDFGWTHNQEREGDPFPWTLCLADQTRICGEVVQLETPDKRKRQFVINATPISGGSGQTRGVLVSFDDVTVIETKNLELAKMIQTLRSSRDEVARQNEQLNFLASYDPLTKCMNRRAFFGKFEKHWAESADGELAIMMLDVDHFKSVNDNHGHSVGDEVLKEMGRLLRDEVAQRGLVCRYGGEEFVILIPDLEFDEAMQLAETIRRRIQSTEAAGIRFTASIGVSSRHFGSMDAQHMLDQADESLYAAKRSGRNRVVRFDQREDQPEEEPTQADEETFDEEIAYSSVTGLLSALSYRCQATAEHSIRVANLCVALGEKRLDSNSLYQLEIAALLHDIGKIGVPESIISKSVSLTSEEWQTLRKHNSIGVEIVRSTLGAGKIAEIIQSHHQDVAKRYEALQDSSPPAKSEIARIITVCDAFDSMITGNADHCPASLPETAQFLVSNSPRFFDPEVVTALLHHLQSGHPIKPTGFNLASKSRSAESISKRMDELESGMAEEDVERLAQVVNHIQNEEHSQNVFPTSGSIRNWSLPDAEEVETIYQKTREVIKECRDTISGSSGKPIPTQEEPEQMC